MCARGVNDPYKNPPVYGHGHNHPVYPPKGPLPQPECKDPNLSVARLFHEGDGVVSVKLTGTRCIAFLPDWVEEVFLPEVKGTQEIMFAREKGQMLTLKVTWAEDMVLNEEPGPASRVFSVSSLVHLVHREGQEWITLVQAETMDSILEMIQLGMITFTQEMVDEIVAQATAAQQAAEAAQGEAETQASRAEGEANRSRDEADRAEGAAGVAVGAANIASSAAGPLQGGLAGQVLQKHSNADYDYIWESVSGYGDMQSSLYDPDGKNANAFSMENMDEGPTQKIMTDAERTKLGGIQAGAQVNPGLATTTDNGLMSAADKAKLTSVGDFALPLGGIIWWPGKRGSEPDGFTPLDGQLVSRANSPIWPLIQSGQFMSVTDVVWLGSNAHQAKFSSGNGTTTFRFPDLNGKQSGTLQGLFLRGDGHPDHAAGSVHGDAIRNITGNFTSNGMENATVSFDGALFSLGGAAAARASGSSQQSVILGFDASRVVPTAAENRPVAAAGIWIMRTHGSMVPDLAPTAPATKGSNTFTGSQAVNGDMAVSGTLTGKAPGGDASKFLRGNGTWGGVLGEGMVWTNVLASRAVGTAYLNNTGRPIEVSIHGDGPSSNFGTSDDGVTWLSHGDIRQWQTFQVTIPNNTYYRVAPGATLTAWLELR